VEVACTAALSDLGLLGVPGSQTLHGRYTAPVDRFRGVSLGFVNSEGSLGANSRAVASGG
jgi:hypothetical protein